MITLTAGFSVISEGWHTFRIDDVTYDPDFGKLEIVMTAENGMKHRERYMLLKGNSEPNEKALNAFSYFAKVALNDFSVTDLDEKKLIGHYIKGLIKHDVRPSTKDPTKTVTFANITEKESADGFEPSKTASALSALLSDD